MAVIFLLLAALLLLLFFYSYEYSCLNVQKKNDSLNDSLCNFLQKQVNILTFVSHITQLLLPICNEIREKL